MRLNLPAWTECETCIEYCLHGPPRRATAVLWTVFTSAKDIENLFGEDGNVIGIAQTLGQVAEKRPPIEDPEIKNLYHCSADSGMHGIGGELAADSALRLFEMLM